MADEKPEWACYVRQPDAGWIIDTCAGGAYTFDVTQAKTWPSKDAMREELEASDLIYSDKYAVDIETGKFVPVIDRYSAVRVK